MDPCVSVIIPVHNGARTIRRAVSSVRSQFYPSVEIIVVDDASSDETAEVLFRLSAEDLRVVALPAQAGVSRARNIGIAQARGEFIAFLDADDEWLPGKLERQVAWMRSNPACTLVAGYTKMVGEDGYEVVRSIFPERGTASDGPEAWRRLLQVPFVCTSVTMVRRSALDRTGGFDENLRVGEDQDLWIRLALTGEIGFIEELLGIKYERPRSLSRENALDVANHTLPMVLRHVEHNQARLSRREVRQILGARLAAAGRAACYAGFFSQGSRLLARAILLNYTPLSNLSFLLKTAPASRLIKRRFVETGHWKNRAM